MHCSSAAESRLPGRCGFLIKHVVLNSCEYKELNEGKWWDLSWYSQGETAESADVEMDYYQLAPAEQLDLVIVDFL